MVGVVFRAHVFGWCVFLFQSNSEKAQLLVCKVSAHQSSYTHLQKKVQQMHIPWPYRLTQLNSLNSTHSHNDTHSHTPRTRAHKPKDIQATSHTQAQTHTFLFTCLTGILASTIPLTTSGANFLMALTQCYSVCNRLCAYVSIKMCTMFKYIHMCTMFKYIHMQT